MPLFCFWPLSTRYEGRIAIKTVSWSIGATCKSRFASTAGLNLVHAIARNWVDWEVLVQRIWKPLGLALVLGIAATVHSGSLSFATETQAQEAEQTAPALTAQQEAIRDRLTRLPKATGSERARANRMSEWYAERAYQPIWIRDGKPTTASERITFMLIKAYEDGLDPDEYAAIGLFGKLASKTDEGLADFEISLSNAAILYGQHLRAGRVEPNKINRELVLYPDQISAQGMLSNLADEANAAENLALLAPPTDRYRRLKSLLQSLRIVQGGGGWVTIPEGEVIKENDEDPRIAVLRKRLEQSGDLPQGAHTGNKLDGNLFRALRYFQYRTGLETDGALGPATRAELNVSVDERIQQVELNLERRRWMQADFGERYIFVNLADQVLKLVDKGKTVHAALVQVGLPFHATPVFTDEMEYLDFNPYWNVPYSIATKEYLPKLKQNPYALASKKIRVLKGGSSIDPGAVPWTSYSRAKFPVRLRQDPGPDNALGRVKFMFPNKYSIYIHDTPSKSKFANASRYFSHGCVRVRDPFALAEKILGFQGVSRAKIDSIVRSAKNTKVSLKQKIPVHIAYLTAWVNKDGSIHYRRDIYGRDKILAAALKKSGS